MLKLSDLKIGLTVFATGKGPTPSGKPINHIKIWPVEITRIDEAKRLVWAVWNHPRPREYTEVCWSRWYLEMPTIVTDDKGRQRIVIAKRKAAPRVAAAA